MELPATMKAMVLKKPGEPLIYGDVPLPSINSEQVLVRVIACGVCRTDLHVVDGELTHPVLPLIPGHEIIGTVVKKGDNVTEPGIGDHVGIPWLGYTCGKCRYCLREQENLCEAALFTGYTVNGGYAEYIAAYSKYCFRLPDKLTAPGYSPLLCAGLIGYRSYSMCGKFAKRIGMYGFGAAAHIIIQVALKEGKEVYAFVKPGDEKARQFALSLGAVWAGYSGQAAPVQLDAAIIFASAGELVVSALRDVDKGGRVICGGIHMSNIPSFPYELLWGERTIRSVANLTRKDALEFLPIAQQADIQTHTTAYPLEQANEALNALRSGQLEGAAVLIM